MWVLVFAMTLGWNIIDSESKDQIWTISTIWRCRYFLRRLTSYMNSQIVWNSYKCLGEYLIFTVSEFTHNTDSRCCSEPNFYFEILFDGAGRKNYSLCHVWTVKLCGSYEHLPKTKFPRMRVSIRINFYISLHREK